MSKAAELANLIGNINMGGGGVNRNLIINGSMNVAQRGTSSTGLGASDGYFTVDRFQLDFGNTAGRLTMTQDSSAPSGFANSMKLACTTADTSIAVNESLVVKQIIEGQNVQAFAKGTADAKPFAVSFYVKGNASATYVCALYDADNTRYIAKTFSVTTDWTRVEITFPADTTGAFDDDNAESLHLWIWLHAGSNFTSGTLATSWASYSNATTASGGSSFFDSTSRTFFITGVQLEVGQNPTEFEHEPFERTLAKCQRYYFVLAEGDDEPILDGGMYNSTIFLGGVTFPVTMRTSPTLDEVEGTNYFNIIMDGGNDLADGIGINRDGNTHCAIEVSGNASGTAGHSAQVRTGNASAKVRFKAEL
jgi:hypothetical protein